MWSLNYVLAERGLDRVGASELSDEADRLLGAAGRAHRKVEIHDAAAAKRLEPQFRRLGWSAEHDIVMTYTREPDREADIDSVDEVEPAELESAWAEATRTEPWGADESVVRELVEQRHVLAAAGARFFTARVDGEIASMCELYSDGRTAQIESVLTLERFRNRGLARAVVLRALAEARAAGNDLTFLLAHHDDWPRHLYTKLGFGEIGSIYDFLLRR